MKRLILTIIILITCSLTVAVATRVFSEEITNNLSFEGEVFFIDANTKTISVAGEDRIEVFDLKETKFSEGYSLAAMNIGDTIKVEFKEKEDLKEAVLVVLEKKAIEKSEDTTEPTPELPKKDLAPPDTQDLPTELR